MSKFINDTLTIQSHKGPYFVNFSKNTLQKLSSLSLENRYFIIDSNLAKIYHDFFQSILNTDKVMLIEATEKAKTLHQFTDYIKYMAQHSVRRTDKIVAIGGGIIQDIAAFLATTFLRGLKWEFYPTTLLAQADSCIGSKSSINVENIKNIIGTYCPPENIFIDVNFLDTLTRIDIHSGIGEMLKVHAIAGPEYYSKIAKHYDKLKNDHVLLLHFIKQSLEIKKSIIEKDEFDVGPRNVMNYGHSFGHAIETATCFSIPHGIAITIGMDLANYVSVKLGYTSNCFFEKMHHTLIKNALNFHKEKFLLDDFFLALNKDKKNTGKKLGLILLNESGIPHRVTIDNSVTFREICVRYFSEVINESV